MPIGGPSADLTPAYNRRTVYGKVSRYKLDEYLQLFDFPTPNISAEKRFTTTVPLQRLFLMNSDFMQVQAEEIAKRIAPEPDNRARVKKLYQLVYGRVPTEQEIQIGVAYVKSEPLLEYEESKKKAAEQSKGAGPRKRGGGEEGKSPETPPSGDAAAAGMAMKPEKKADEASAAASTPEKPTEAGAEKKKEEKTVPPKRNPRPTPRTWTIWIRRRRRRH